jgi:hypothetical protein
MHERRARVAGYIDRGLTAVHDVQEAMRPTWKMSGVMGAESGKRDYSRPLASGRVENWRAHCR